MTTPQTEPVPQMPPPPGALEVQRPVPHPAEIARHYEAALDSVRLLLAGKPEYMPEQDWPDCIKRNVDHLKHMMQNPWWDGYDLAPFQQAIDAHQ